MPQVILARAAMNTRFELVVHGDRPATLRAAAEEALNEVARLEEQLSLFRPASEIARLNALAAREPVRVSPEVFALLSQARQLWQVTGGAFDITLAPLLRCWGLLGRSDGRVPTDAELAEARAACGMNLVELDATRRTVRFTRPGVMLDLGALGKGYAVDKAVELLREAGVESALLHGGTSTVYALGSPPEAEGWKVAIPSPDGPDQPPLATLNLRDESLSVSAVAGKCFTVGKRVFGHVLDARTGQPAHRARLAALLLPSAAETDALSTALLVLGTEGLSTLQAFRPVARGLVVAADGTVQAAGLSAKRTTPGKPVA
ncbi:MAG: FAD:protein FMN transferase [Limisphaerales bacterium]